VSERRRELSARAAECFGERRGGGCLAGMNWGVAVGRGGGEEELGERFDGKVEDAVAGGVRCGREEAVARRGECVPS